MCDNCLLTKTYGIFVTQGTQHFTTQRGTFTATELRPLTVKWHTVDSSLVASQQGTGSRPLAGTLPPRVNEKH